MSGINGEKRLVTGADKVVQIALPKTTTQAQVFSVKAGPKSVYVSAAGATDFTIQFTTDSHDAVARGLAVWSPPAKYNNVNGDVYIGNIPFATGVKVDGIKTASSAADDAGRTSLLGGRAFVRVVTIDPYTDHANDMPGFAKATAAA
jgi:hypothetical protein